MKKINIKKRLPIFLIAAAIIVGIIGYNVKARGSSAPEVSVITLKKTTLTKSVPASGKIQSNIKKEIYALQAYPLKKVFVEEGDFVREGDVLAEYDMEALESQIKQTEINIEKIKNTEADQLQSLNDNVVASGNSVEQSSAAVKKAQLVYDMAKASYENGDEIVSAKASAQRAKAAVDQSKTALDRATDQYESNKQLFAAGAISSQSYENYKKAFEDAQTAYDLAVAEYNTALKGVEIAEDNAKKSVMLAEADLNNAKTALNATESNLELAKNKTVSNSALEVELQQITLLDLQSKLEDKQIKATATGTITWMNAAENMIPSGKMFIIEDIEDLYVDGSINEYNIGKVSIGQRAIIKTEATGESEIECEVSGISQSAIQDSGGSSNVEYKTKFDILQNNSQLKIGMNARVSVIEERRENVFSAPYDCIVETDAGPVIFIAEDGVAREVPVIKGLETDAGVEISASGHIPLKEGLQIITNSANIKDGNKVSFEK